MIKKAQECDARMLHSNYAARPIKFLLKIYCYVSNRIILGLERLHVIFHLHQFRNAFCKIVRLLFEFFYLFIDNEQCKSLRSIPGYLIVYPQALLKQVIGKYHVTGFKME